MVQLQKLGGVAAILAAATFIFGFWFYFAVIGPAQYGSSSVEPLRHAAFLVEHRALLTVWNLTIYVGFGALLVVLAVALHERVKAGAPALSVIGTAFGLIWAGLVIASGMVANIGMAVIVDLFDKDPAQAGNLWLSYKFVVAGLGGGNEIVGGLWVTLMSIAALRCNALPRWLCYLGVVIGGAGLLTTIPALGELGSIFGLGLIVWFIWTGVVLLRGQRSPRGAVIPTRDPYTAP